ncbi:MAG: phosphoglucosamine mutase [Planctomycetota bacterium]|jgi:phosphomannomutase|nr:phosphoglucosamine mutase [Planctomycetota bacterium]
MSKLMIGISGVRGVVGDNLTPELLVNLGQAFGTWADSGTVAVGRDTRVSGDMVKHAVFSGLLSAGCRIVDVGVCGTPSAAMMIRKLGANGGIIISASHNPIEWNALKFFRADGVYLNQEQGRELLDIYYGGDVKKVGYDKLNAVETDNGAAANHLRRLLAIVDVPALRKRRFRVAVDCCNGAGSALALEFLRVTGCEIFAIDCEMNGLFRRNPEPTREHVTAICGVVRENAADLGFAEDADADRVAFISEKGDYIGEEYSLCLAASHVLSRRRGRVVTNLSTTRMIDDVARGFDCEVVRTPVGEVNVAEAMIAGEAVIGGEGNGGVIDPRVHYGRDALTGVAIILQYMLESGKPLSRLAAAIPAYRMSKQRVECSKRSFSPVLKVLAREKADRVDTRDGVKLDFAEGWVNIRPSNTEPIVRVYAEARSQDEADKLAERYRLLVERLVKTAK